MTEEGKKTILISGATSGIGLALAREYAATGSNLILLSRNQEKLETVKNQLQNEFAKSTIHIVKADVQYEQQIIEALEKIKTVCMQLDLLVCNAGILKCGRFEQGPIAETHQAMEINYWGMHYMVYHFLPLVKASGNAHIAFVSSVAGYTGLFGYSHYAPSKFAIAGLAECLRMEFKDYGVGISVIYPPDTETPMLEFERANTLPECRALSQGASTIAVKKAAQQIINGIENKKFEIYFNFESRFIRILKGTFPSAYYGIVDRIVNKSRKKTKQ